jgi:hypothetical protein
MSRRKFALEEKLAILKEAEANGITQTIRYHGIYAKMVAAVRSTGSRRRTNCFTG